MSIVGERVLVTGARGFLGRHLCRRLREDGAVVHAASRAHRAGDDGALRWWCADLEDYEATRDLLAAIEPSVIVHLAGRASAAPALALVLPTFHSLLLSTVNLLAAGTELRCGRLVVVGSLEEPAAGGREVAPASPYGAAKWAAGAYARMFHHLYAAPVVVVRLFMTYGPGQAPDKVIPSTILSLLGGRPPRLSAGARPLDWIYVDDAIEGLVRVAAAEGLDGATMDLGTGQPVPLRTIVRHLVDLVDPAVEPIFGAVPDRPFNGAHAADAAATQARLGWRARIPLEVGLERTVEWYRAAAGAGKDQAS